ncbi:hypothetical protein U1Q18_007587, partial [Sarracenia purpurea var. burkii]
ILSLADCLLGSKTFIVLQLMDSQLLMSIHYIWRVSPPTEVAPGPSDPTSCSSAPAPPHTALVPLPTTPIRTVLALSLTALASSVFSTDVTVISPPLLQTLL